MRAHVAEIRELQVGQTRLAHTAMSELRTACSDAQAFVEHLQPASSRLGTSRERFDAHPLYYNHGLAIHSSHFARGV